MGNVILTGQQADIKALEIAWEACGKPAGVMFHSDSNNAGVSPLPPLSLPFNPIGVITDAVKTFPHHITTNIDF